MTEARRIPQPARERRGIHTLALLVVLALVLRALVPQGYMPALHGERKGFVLPLVLCTQQGMVEIAPDASGRLPTHLADSLGEELAAEITAQFTAQFKADFETDLAQTHAWPADAPLVPASAAHLFGQMLAWCAFGMAGLQHGLWQAGLSLPVWVQAPHRTATVHYQTPQLRLAVQAPEARGPPTLG